MRTFSGVFHIPAQPQIRIADKLQPSQHSGHHLRTTHVDFDCNDVIAFVAFVAFRIGNDIILLVLQVKKLAPRAQPGVLLRGCL